MAYQAKRKKFYTEQFELTEEDGTVVHTLQVALDADSVVRNLSEKHMALVKTLQEVRDLKKASTEEEKGRSLEVLGRAVTDLIEAVFGAENTHVIVDFYQNRYIEMCTEVVPFITNVVIPNVRRIAKENKKQVLAGYNRRQRRFLGRK